MRPSPRQARDRPVGENHAGDSDARRRPSQRGANREGHGRDAHDRPPHRGPGPALAEILERKERGRRGAALDHLPDRRRGGRRARCSPTSTATRSSTSPAASAASTSATRTRSVVAAAQEQLERFAHTDFTIVPYEVYVELAERLIELAPIAGPAKAAFFNAGTEAVENAVKFARAYTAAGRDRASRAPSTAARCCR